MFTDNAEFQTAFNVFRAELLKDIRAVVEEALAVGARPAPPTGAGDDAMVDVAYVAALFNTSVYSARRGRGGTYTVRWTSRHPLRCTRKEAHDALQRWVDEKERPARTRGLIRRSKRT